MRKYRDYRNNFSAGVVSEEYLARSRDEVTGQALKQGLNAFLTDAATVRRRCGTNRMFRGQDEGRTFEFEMEDGTLRHLVFYNLGLKVYQSDGTLDATLAAPWVTADLFTMSIAVDKDNLIICSASFWPQQVMMTPGAFSIGNLMFRTDVAGRRAAPFVGSGLFGLETVTMTPSGYSGNILLNFDADVLVADHVGARFRYMRNQILITGVTNARQASATVIDRLYPTVRVGVSNATAFRAGDLCEGDVTNVRGQIAAVGPSWVDVVLTEGYSTFLAPSGEASGEQLISVEANEAITSISSVASPAGTNIWSEELISVARGYPSTCAMHRQRLVLGGFRVAPSMIVASALGEIDDFDLGAGSKNDAIQEFIGEDPNAIIKHLVSTEQLIILTDRGSWYVPEAGNQQFTPEGVGFDPIGPDPASDVPPVWTPEGVVFLDLEDRALLLSVTGTQRGAYSTTDITLLGNHLITNPKQMVYASGVGGRQERVITVLNGDGTAAVFNYRRGADQAGWVPWERGSGGEYVSFSAFNNRLFCYAKSDALLNYEEFDFDAVIDSEFAPDMTDYVSETVDLLLNSHVIGEGLLDEFGALEDLGELSGVDRLGHDFAVTIEPTPMVIAQAGRQRRRNARTFVDTINSGLFAINGKQCAAYPYDGDLETQPMVTDKEYRASQLGSSRDRTILIQQAEGEGAPLHIRSLTIEVAAR